jgi:hypothetical protein
VIGWRTWAKALGEKAGSSDKEADRVALIRTGLVGYNLITNTFIIVAATLSIIVNTKVLGWW